MQPLALISGIAFPIFEKSTLWSVIEIAFFALLALSLQPIVTWFGILSATRGSTSRLFSSRR